ERNDLADLRQRADALLASRPPSIPRGAVESILYALDVAQRIDGTRFETQAQVWQRRARAWLERVEAGVDPFPEQRGKIVSRGYWSPVSERRQGYTVYLPPNYDPQRTWPLMLVLHGGSSNGNLFLGVVLGNNMSWKSYPLYLWNDF